MTNNAEPLYPDLKRSKPQLANGWHLTRLCSISEYKHPYTGESCLKLVFEANEGQSSVLLPIVKESIFILNKIAGMAEVSAEKYRLSDLVNATLLIQIKYKRIIKIKKP